MMDDMSESGTYIYFEGCGFESDPFTAASDAAAQAHVEATFRSADNADFDGDEGGIIRVEADGWREVTVRFPGENMIADPTGARRSHMGA